VCPQRTGRFGTVDHVSILKYVRDMKSLRPVLSVLFALVLTLTGQSMAVARGANDATGQMVLCTGQGSVTVYMDEQGRPTAAPHVCPECVVTALTSLIIAPFELPLQVSMLSVSSVEVAHPVISLMPSSYLPRAPPALV
jgi:hypothetical protein